MASLSSIITKYSEVDIDEQNLEKGQITLYANGTDTAKFCSGIHHRFQQPGTAIIEVWGASGSGGEMCCCGIGLPGNPGAYAKKTIRVDSSTWMCIDTGFSCGNANTLCFRGCSEPSTVIVCSPNGLLVGGQGNASCICLCAQGGMGGMHLCMEACSPFTRYAGCNYDTTQVGNNGCGIVCNYGSTYNWLPAAYGGDFVRDGTVSCLFVGHCNMCCYDCYKSYIATSAGIWSEEAQVFEHSYPCSDWKPHRNDGFSHYMQQVNGMSRMPTAGSPMWFCYNSSSYCGCYNYQGCQVVVTHGIPGYGGLTCTSITDKGGRGGHGAVKIRFIRDEQ